MSGQGAAATASAKATAHRAHRQRQAAQAPPPDTLSPADRYQELFEAVQRSDVFPDSKTFVDCVPLGAPADILDVYRARCGAAGFDLREFVAQHFRAVMPSPSDYESVPGQDLAGHIDGLWGVLTRRPQAHAPHASTLQLPHPYVVPGGRFGELYYWDSYFTMLGLAASGRTGLLRAMVDNFSFLIDTYGHIPNGTRTYYLSRSQPPVFVLMVELAQQCGLGHCADHLPQLRQEHAYWMAGEAGLAPGTASRRVVRLADGTLLNRYWDDRDTPREESWLEDVTTAQSSRREAAQVYRDLRAAAESGWDFSSRWLREPAPEASAGRLAAPRAGTAPSLASICTTDILPVDLNAFLYKLEQKIAELADQHGDEASARAYSARAVARAAAVQALCWDPDQAAFFDHDWRLGQRRHCLTAACVVPLFVGLLAPGQAAALARTLEQRLLAPGGLATTECRSDQQWDRPNGWAPLQWMAIKGLTDQGQAALAATLTDRWLTTVGSVYGRSGKLVEKYRLREVSHEHAEGGGGGEYPLQDGFGWTNGVTRALLALQPGPGANRAGAVSPSAEN
ncbi:MAG: alpha,alpha-trehalase TreF [Ramlibacter sp.]